MKYKLTPRYGYQHETPHLPQEFSGVTVQSSVSVPAYRGISPHAAIYIVDNESTLPHVSAEHTSAAITYGTLYPQPMVIGGTYPVHSYVLIREKYFTLNALAHELNHASEFMYWSFKPHSRAITPYNKAEIMAMYTGYMVDNALIAYKHYFRDLLGF